MFRSSIEKRLGSLTKEMRSLQEHLAMVEEQLLQVVDEADDARLRAMVSETPLANAEHSEAARVAAAFKKDRDATIEKMRALEAKQDLLLDQLAAERQR